MLQTSFQNYTCRDCKTSQTIGVNFDSFQAEWIPPFPSTMEEIFETLSTPIVHHCGECNKETTMDVSYLDIPMGASPFYPYDSKTVFLRVDDHLWHPKNNTPDSNQPTIDVSFNT